MTRFPLVLAALLAIASATPAPAAETAVPLKTTEFGHGPTIVMVHDFGSARMQWMPTARKLLAQHHVVLVDLPGHGDSPLPDPFSLEAAAASIAGVLAKEQGDSTVVVGQGLGGMLALMAASAHPEAVKGVVIIDGWVKTPQAVPEQMQNYFLQMLDSNYDAMLKQMFISDGLDSAQGVVIHAKATLVPPASIKAYLRQLLNADASGALKTLKPRLLYIGTSKHWPAEKKWAELAPSLGYAGAGPMETRRIEKAAALVASDQPDTLAAVLGDFASRAIAGK